jgi:hypothetical protein
MRISVGKLCTGLYDGTLTSNGLRAAFIVDELLKAELLDQRPAAEPDG